MSRQIQIRRGTAAQHETFTGADGELTFDGQTLRVHDGTTVGGIILARADEIPDTDNISQKFCVPDYSRGISVTTFPFTAPETGVCIWTNTAGDGASKWAVNGTELFGNRCRDYINIEVFVPLAAGDILSYIGNSNAANMKFFPYKFV